MYNDETREPQAVDTSAFRTTVRVKKIAVKARPGCIGEYNRDVRIEIGVAHEMARLFPLGPEDRALKSLGLK